LPNEKHEFSAGWRAAQKGGPLGCTLRRAGGLHIKLGCGKGRGGGLHFSTARPVLFRSPPDCFFVQPALVSSVQHASPPKVHVFHLETRTSSLPVPPALQLVLSVHDFIFCSYIWNTRSREF